MLQEHRPVAAYRRARWYREVRGHLRRRDPGHARATDNLGSTLQLHVHRHVAKLGAGYRDAGQRLPADGRIGADTCHGRGEELELREVSALEIPDGREAAPGVDPRAHPYRKYGRVGVRLECGRAGGRCAEGGQVVLPLSPDVGEAPPGIDRAAGHRQRGDRGVGVGVPGRGVVGVDVREHGGDVVAGRSAHAGERPTRVHRRAVAAERQCAHGRVADRVPGRRVVGIDSGAERRDIRAGLTAYGGERASGVQGGAVDRQGVDRGAGVRVPRRGHGCVDGGVKSGNAVPGLAADSGESASGVDRGTRDDDRVDCTVAGRDPGGWHPGRGAHRRQVGACEPAHRREGPAHVHGRGIPAERYRVDGGAGVWIPGRRYAGGRGDSRQPVPVVAPDAVERAARVDARPVDGERQDGVVSVGVPGGGEPGGNVQPGDVVASLPADGYKGPACKDGRCIGAHDKSADSRAGVRVPRRGHGCVDGRVKSGDAVPGLAADRGEAAARVNRIAAYGKGGHGGAGGGVPGGRRPGGGVHRRDVHPGEATHGGEGTPGVDRGRCNGQRAHRAARVTVPGGRQPGGGAQRGYPVSRLPADGSKRPSRVDRARVGAERQRVDDGAGGRVGVPAGSVAIDRVQRGDVVARLPADRGERAAHVNGPAGERQSAHGTV